MDEKRLRQSKLFVIGMQLTVLEGGTCTHVFQWYTYFAFRLGNMPTAGHSLHWHMLTLARLA